MGAEEEDRGIAVEDVLRAVAVVHVPIDDEDAFDAVLLLRVAGRDGDVVEQAEAHAAAGIRMVSGGPHRAEGIAGGAGEHGIHRVQYAAGSAGRHVPRVGRDFGVAGAQVGAAGVDIAAGGLQVLGGVAELQLVIGGGAGLGAAHAVEQSGARESRR